MYLFLTILSIKSAPQLIPITADSQEEKLIVSEKAVKEEELGQKLSQLKIGMVVEGTVTGVVDFGAFVKFGEMEGSFLSAFS
jgi:ribosomal protein S1